MTALSANLQEKLANVPAKSGIYLFRDAGNKILYVGKAKELRNRLRSYFQKASSLDPRKTAMIRDVRDFEYTVTENELEAFILEANLIKQYRPRYNILLRDDKSYPYLKLTINEEWPRLEVVRRIQKDGAKYYGPYVPAGAMWNTLSFIRNNFNIPTCCYSLERRMRPCIQHQIKKCIAPCSGRVSRKEYLNMIKQVSLLLEGKNKGLLEFLERKMLELSEEMRYEEAAVVRDRIKAIRRISESQKAVAPGLGDIDVIGIFRSEEAIVVKLLFIRNGIMIGSRHFFIKDVSGEHDEYLMKNFIGQFYSKEIIPPSEILCSVIPEDPDVLASWLTERKGSAVRISVPKRGLKKKLVKMAEENAEILHSSEEESGRKAVMKEIASFLDLDRAPADIGAFDISNISGKEPVGAFVYWSGGGFEKGKYRHIRMDAVQGPDDYAMMKEMIRRTITNLGSDLPDLLIIDGGRGHLDAALEAFEKSNITDRYIIAVAKDPDRVFLKGVEQPLELDGGGAAQLLLRKIRDEAHRFAIRYHKKLRSKRSFESLLEKVPGVGRKRRLELLRYFGGVDAVRSSTVEEIAKIKGFNRKVAEAILNSLADS